MHGSTFKVTNTNARQKRARRTQNCEECSKNKSSFFADDALFFFKALPQNCWAIKSVLARFCDISGEMINFDKSHVIFSPNTPPKFMKIMRRPLGVESKSTIGNYLGCPMEVDGRNTWSFNTLITKTVDKIL